MIFLQKPFHLSNNSPSLSYGITFSTTAKLNNNKTVQAIVITVTLYRVCQGVWPS